MEQYTGFASVYDLFMDNVPYDEWTASIDVLLKKYGIKPGPNTEVPLICELGCGTGNITRRLKARGYDMIGISGRRRRRKSRAMTRSCTFVRICANLSSTGPLRRS